jgi:hypothetical protein
MVAVLASISAQSWPTVAYGTAQPQPQLPPQHPPPPPPLAGPALARPPTATVDRSFTVSSWPSGQVQGADDSLIGRVRSKVAPQARHLYSYRGTGPAYARSPRPWSGSAGPAVAVGTGPAGRAALSPLLPAGTGRAGAGTAAAEPGVS